MAVNGMRCGGKVKERDEPVRPSNVIGGWSPAAGSAEPKEGRGHCHCERQLYKLSS
jgi:hypothetical protein